MDVVGEEKSKVVPSFGVSSAKLQNGTWICFIGLYLNRVYVKRDGVRCIVIALIS